MTEPEEECYCPKCGWKDRWEDADQRITHEPMGEAWGSAVQMTVTTYICPVCDNDLEEVEVEDD